jgi:putative DNA methylase
MSIKPFTLRNTPALIEKLLPVQKLSAEVYKERMSGTSQTLTALGGFWKGRKPLILNKAVILGCLLPTTADLERDLEIFEKLMAMDDESFSIRMGAEKAEATQNLPYRERVTAARRPEELGSAVHSHIWEDVNEHLGTEAHNIPELVEQLGVLRYGHRPRLGDTFSGSGQIPFEAARLGCNVYASDLNPVACMLTWGAFNVIGGSAESREELKTAQKRMVSQVQAEIDELGIESDGNGWKGKSYLYCVEVKCPQTGWMVPLLSTRIISKGYRVIAELHPDPFHKRYDVLIKYVTTEDEILQASMGTVRSDGRGQEPYIIHSVGGIEYRTKISTLRGDYHRTDGSVANQLRLWKKTDFAPLPGDIYQERLYAIMWARPSNSGRGEEYEFRSVTEDDMDREQKVHNQIATYLEYWQNQGWLPDMRIEPGEKTDEPIRTRGWTYWHHLFNPRQLLIAGLIRRSHTIDMPFLLSQILNVNCRLSRWNPAPGPGRAGKTSSVFDNQALNTLFNYGCRGFSGISSLLQIEYKSFPFKNTITTKVEAKPVTVSDEECDIFITDPPYGDAVKYEEILEFFIAWLRKNPPPEFTDWVWDSRRVLAIKGEDEAFRRGMVAAYRRMAEHMPDNGIQVIMFTHQSGSIWADMANIVWASGLQVTAAWYVVTETDSALRQGSYVKGTVLLVLRKRKGQYKATRDDLAWEIQEEVEAQVSSLTGLNQQAKALYRDENLFEDADLQMAGYAAALRVLTKYAIINGREMAGEAIRPRQRGEKSFVDELIEFAVDVANQSLVPLGIESAHWNRRLPAERFYLKMLELEARGMNTLDNYQNFAKAFKVEHFQALMASEHANSARLKSSVELGRSEMAEGSEFYNTVLRGLLYAVMEIVKGVDTEEVLKHLAFNVPDFYDQTQREVIIELSSYLAQKLAELRPEEASAARVLRESVYHQQM